MYTARIIIRPFDGELGEKTREREGWLDRLSASMSLVPWNDSSRQTNFRPFKINLFLYMLLHISFFDLLYVYKNNHTMLIKVYLCRKVISTYEIREVPICFSCYGLQEFSTKRVRVRRGGAQLINVECFTFAGATRVPKSCIISLVSEFLESRACRFELIQNFLLLVLFLLFELPSRRISEGLAERSRRKMRMKKKKKKKTEKTEQKKGRRIHWEERINSG
ncbi:hypothetical protein ALC60_11347 [Trachymyrmex zeteki]|uniref:Uncharacterized protein n=1 Tax=Mycetomoellerius zeteki TaxID=64791 RepID=A0A151WP36_9HYME|nr:hypothetical protein ALC60_11347 [Trachymyrmex zeteki]